MRLTPLEWGLRAPITPRLGGNCWALPRLGEIGAKRRIINRPKTQNFGYFLDQRLLPRARLALPGGKLPRGPSIFIRSNHQLESRMREICQSGSGEGAVQPRPYLIQAGSLSMHRS